MGQKCAKKDKCHRNDGRWLTLALRGRQATLKTDLPTWIEKQKKKTKKGMGVEEK